MNDEHLIDTPQWKIDKIRSYFNGGWEPMKISAKLNVPTHQVINIIYGDPIQTTMMGSKDAPYYEDEMDYVNLGRPDPLPNYRLFSERSSDIYSKRTSQHEIRD